MEKRKRKQKINQISETNELQSFESYLEMFLQECEIKNLAYHTIRWHKENLISVFKALEHLNIPTNELTEEALKQCVLYWKREKNNSPTTINHRITSFKKLVEFLQGAGLITDFPIKLEKLKAPKTLIQPFSEEDLKKLLAQPDKSTFVGLRDYTMMLVFLDTGVRLIEVENMQASNVNLRDSSIIVMGKGSKEREVYFHFITKDYLRRYIAVRGDLEHDFLWVNEFSQPLKRRTIGQRLTGYGRGAKLTKVRVSPHTFRHTCAKQYIKNGGDIISLQKLLGHSTLEMVRHYVNLWGTDLKKMHQKFSPVEHLYR